MESSTITRTLVPEKERLTTTEELFGMHFPLRLEPVIYSITQTMASDYHGGYWDFFTLSNGGFYMAPGEERVFPVQCANCWHGDLSSDALGITACLYAYSHLSFLPDQAFARLCADHYHRLRGLMCEHAEVGHILQY